MSSTSGVSDASTGRIILSTRIKLATKAVSWCFFGGALPVFCLSIFIGLTSLSTRQADHYHNLIVDSIWPQSAHLWRVRGEDSKRWVVVSTFNDKTTSAWISREQYKQQFKTEISSAHSKMWSAFWIGVALAAGSYVLMFFILRATGRFYQTDRRLRGAKDVLAAYELDDLVKKDIGKNSVRGQRLGRPFRLAGVTFPWMALMQGILIVGAPGSGKSLVFHDLMQQVFQRRKRKVIIYDQSGEFFKAYYRPGKDYFFNPALIGSVPWSIFSELTYNYDTNSAAQAFLPPKDSAQAGPNGFFEDAARALFSVLLRRLAGEGRVNTADLANAFLNMQPDEMDKLIENSVASSSIGGDSKGQRQGVISSIAIYLDGMQAVKKGSWSIRNFLEEDSDARFFLLGTQDTKAMFAPMYRLILTMAFNAIAAKAEVIHRDKYWFFLDELNQLGDIRLDEVTATMRKFGVVIPGGIQSESQFESTMGKSRALTVGNCWSSILALRANEPLMREKSAKRIGKQEISQVTGNQQLATSEWRDGAALNFSNKEQWVVMPDEFGELPDCHGFIKISGFPVAKVNYQHWLKRRFYIFSSKASTNDPIQELPQRDPDFLIENKPAVPESNDVMTGEKLDDDWITKEVYVPSNDDHEPEKVEVVEVQQSKFGGPRMPVKTDWGN
jgi:Type IV secretion-system coupling protein DNA-binding domain